jgi:hypothetical protein
MKNLKFNFFSKFFLLNLIFKKILIFMMNSKKLITDKTKDSTGKDPVSKILKPQSTAKDVSKPVSTLIKTGAANKLLKDAVPSLKDVTSHGLKKTTTTTDVNPKGHMRNTSDVHGSKLGADSTKSTLTSKKVEKPIEKVDKSEKEISHANPNTPSNLPSISPNKNYNTTTNKETFSSISLKGEALNYESTNISGSNIININTEKDTSSSLPVTTVDLTSNDTEPSEVINNPTSTTINTSMISSSYSNPSLTSNQVAEELKLQLNLKEQELSQLKKVLQEKKELQEQISSLKKERDEWHKNYQERDQMVNSCIREIEDSSKSLEVLIEQKEEIRVLLSHAEAEVESLKKENEELKNKVTDVELDFELKCEEYESIKIEIENANSKIKTLEEINLSHSTNLSNKESKLKELSLLDDSSANARILELESQVNKLTTTLIKVSEDRTAEALYYKKEIDQLKEKNKSAEKNLKEIPLKDEEIRNLNKKLMNQENDIEELKEQLNVLSSASNMLDDLITQKTQLEIDLTREKEENIMLKGEMDTTDLLIQELENAAKISNDLVREKENELLTYNNKLSSLHLKLEDNENKERQLLSVITDLKNQNKIIREEISKSKNINVDEILNKNLNTKNKLKTLQRQKVLNTLSLIEISKMNLRNKIISTMIPKKTFTKGHIELFDKFLLIQSLRKKTINIIFSIFENDILHNEEFTSSDIEEENNKILLNFLKNVLQTLILFNNQLLTLEILLTTLSPENFKNETTNKINIFMNVSAASQFIDNLINLIKDDSFGVKYQYEGLKSIVKLLSEEIKCYSASLEIDEEGFKKNFGIIQYEYELMNYVFGVLMRFKEGNSSGAGNGEEKNISKSEFCKNIENSYKQFKKTMKMIDEKFFLQISYEESSKVFDLENSYFVKLVENSKIFFNDEKKELDLENLIDTLSKSCVVINSFIEKLEKENSNKISEKSENDNETENSSNSSPSSSKNHNSLLPVKSWIDLTSEVFSELQYTTKIREDLDEANNKLKLFKLEKMELENKYEELLKNKQVNDRKLAEALIQVGKVSQLENEIEEQNKKIAKYNTTIEALVKNIESEQERNKELKMKLESANSQFGKPSNRDAPERQSKRAAVVGSYMASNSNISNQNPNPLGIRVSNTSNFMTDSVPLLNTICELQRERKILKSKLMKDKLTEMFNENSYINRYISKNKTENLEFYEQVEENVQNLNEHYKKTRKELCLPKVYDITGSQTEERKENTGSSRSYEMNKKMEENKITKLRVEYMQEVDKILNTMFGDHSLDTAFKDMIDNDISR